MEIFAFVIIALVILAVIGYMSVVYAYKIGAGWFVFMYAIFPILFVAGGFCIDSTENGGNPTAAAICFILAFLVLVWAFYVGFRQAGIKGAIMLTLCTLAGALAFVIFIFLAMMGSSVTDSSKKKD